MGAAERAAEKLRGQAEKAALRHLKELLRGTGWRIYQTAIFRPLGDKFVVAFLETARNVDRVSFRLEAKPMAVDPLFWAIMDLETNAREPLSLRAWGAFVCDSVTIAESELIAPLPPPDDVAAHFLRWAVDASAAFIEHQGTVPFSQVVEANEHYQARGAYAATLICSLILEGRTSEAAALAQAIASGRRRVVHTQTSEGRTFYERAAEWIVAHPA